MACLDSLRAWIASVLCKEIDKKDESILGKESSFFGACNFLRFRIFSGVI